MKKISTWARKNPWKSRLLIAIIYILIPVLGVLMGLCMLMCGIELSELFLFLATGVFLTGLVCYPDKKQKNKRPFTFNFYKRQKTCDLLLAFSSFLVFGFIGNSSNDLLNSAGTRGNASSISALITPEANFTRPKDEKPSVKVLTTRAERKAIVKKLKTLLKETFRGQNQRDANQGTRVALVILTIIGGVGLSILLAGLSCNLSCTGSETAAVLVLTLGAGAIATLLVLIIRAIHKRYPRKMVPVETINSSN